MSKKNTKSTKVSTTVAANEQINFPVDAPEAAPANEVTTSAPEVTVAAAPAPATPVVSVREVRALKVQISGEQKEAIVACLRAHSENTAKLAALQAQLAEMEKASEALAAQVYAMAGNTPFTFGGQRVTAVQRKRDDGSVNHHFRLQGVSATFDLGS
jgi:hypothetical protein